MLVVLKRQSSVTYIASLCVNMIFSQLTEIYQLMLNYITASNLRETIYVLAWLLQNKPQLIFCL